LYQQRLQFSESSIAISLELGDNSASAAMAPRRKETIGFAQFKGQGPSFYLRQFSGCVVVVVGISCLFMPHFGEADAPLLGINKQYMPFIALTIVCIGTYLHETRPYRVRCCDA
jgi:hypothetical protein